MNKEEAKNRKGEQDRFSKENTKEIQVIFLKSMDLPIVSIHNIE